MMGKKKKRHRQAANPLDQAIISVDCALMLVLVRYGCHRLWTVMIRNRFAARSMAAASCPQCSVK